MSHNDKPALIRMLQLLNILLPSNVVNRLSALFMHMLIYASVNFMHLLIYASVNIIYASVNLCIC